MKTCFSGRSALWFAALALGVSSADSPCAAQDAGNPKLLARLVQEIPLVPSLYGRTEGPVNIDSLPKYPAKKLAPFAFPPKDAAQVEFKRFKANRPKYSVQHPLRASIFEAMDVMDNLQALKMATTIRPAEATPKGKVAFLRQQGNIGIFIFKLEKAQAQMQEAEENRANEPSKRWQAHFDFARASVLSNLIFLFEYDYTLGQVRADNLPALGQGHDGWIIAPRPKITVPEGKAKAYAKDCFKRLKRIQDEYPNTPWAYFADRESRREVGMAWTPKKK